MTDSTAPAERDLAPAVTRSIKVLQLLADSWGEPRPLSDIARTLEAAKSSTSNICIALEAAGMIRRADTGFVLGPRTLEFGAAYLRTVDPVREFYRFCESSRFLVHEVVQVAMLEGTDVIYLARHEGNAPLRLSANIGDRFPAAPTALGNAMLAQLLAEEIAERFATEEAFPRRTSRTTRTLGQLQRKLEQARDRGYAIDDGEVHPGIYGVAVPVPPRSNSAAPLAVGASLLSEELTDARREGVVAELRELATLMTNPLRAAATTNPEDQEPRS